MKKGEKVIWVVYEFDDGVWHPVKFYDSDGSSPRYYPSLKDASMDNFLRKVTKNVYSMHPNEKDMTIVGLLLRHDHKPRGPWY